MSQEDGVRWSNQTAHWNSAVSKSSLPCLCPETQLKETLHSVQSLNYIGTRVCTLRVLSFPHSFMHSASICFQNTPSDGMYYYQCHLATTWEDSGAGWSFDLGIDCKLFFLQPAQLPAESVQEALSKLGWWKQEGQFCLIVLLLLPLFFLAHTFCIPFLTLLSSALGARE